MYTRCHVQAAVNAANREAKAKGGAAAPASSTFNPIYQSVANSTSDVGAAGTYTRQNFVERKKVGGWVWRSSQSVADYLSLIHI